MDKQGKSISRLGANIWNCIPPSIRKLPKHSFNKHDCFLKNLSPTDDHPGLPYSIRASWRIKRKWWSDRRIKRGLCCVENRSLHSWSQTAGLKCRSQVTSQVTGQATGHRPQARSHAGQTTGHRSDHRSQTKTIGHWTKPFLIDILLYKNKTSQGTSIIFFLFWTLPNPTHEKIYSCWSGKEDLRYSVTKVGNEITKVCKITWFVRKNESQNEGLLR